MSIKNRKWEEERRDSKRKVLIPSHLIVTEGMKTEPMYFEGMKNSISRAADSKRIQIEIIGAGKETLRILDDARNIVKYSSRPYHDVWIVYDKDDFPSKDFNSVVAECERETLKTNGETTYHAIWSNECIELWFLLHFEFLQSSISRNDYYSKISGYFRKIGMTDYTKNRNDIFEILRPNLEKAIKFSKKLIAINKEKTPSESNPCTMVGTMMEEFIPYL